MVHCRRNVVVGGTYFFTVTLCDRRSDLLVRHIDLDPKHAPRYYRKKEKGWLESAQKELASLGPG